MNPEMTDKELLELAAQAAAASLKESASPEHTSSPASDSRLIAELRKLAKAAEILDHNEGEGWYSADFIECHGAFFKKNAQFIAACNPATILQMLDLIEILAEDARHWLEESAAMDAYNKFKEGK